MDSSKLSPILNKESILKTANARELGNSPDDVLNRYNTYALTHIPLGTTTKQLNDLERVIVENKTCAVGTIVGPYGYGKTSTAVHLWHEIQAQKIVAVPPFLWTNLDELMDAVYHWIRYEFSKGPKTHLPALEQVYNQLRQQYSKDLIERMGQEMFDELVGKGQLLLQIRASDLITFFSKASEICEQAGYRGLVIFTDELQATLAKYPSRDQFFADLFEMVKDILGLPGHWAIVITMDDDTEGTIARLRSDLLQRLQRSALHFRVKEVYNRREYPKELWSAFEERFGFDGSDVIMDQTLEAIGEVSARSDLGAGPRAVTYAMSLAIKHYERTSQAYSPLHFVNDALAGLMIFDQRGKYSNALKKALDNPDVRNNETLQQVVKLLGAYPMGCSEETLKRFELLDGFNTFPPLARRELIMQQSGGYILRYMAESETPPEQIEQTLTKEFVGRYAPGKQYAGLAATGFVKQVLLDPIFSGWKTEFQGDQKIGDTTYNAHVLRGTFDPRFPDRLVNVMVAAVSQSQAPNFQKGYPDAEIELRFELNFGIAPGEPSRLLIDDGHPNLAIFQLNIATVQSEAANKILPNFLFEYYAADQLTPLLCLSLTEYLFRNRGELPDDHSRINTIIGPLRQFSLAVLLGDQMEISNPEFATAMVGGDRIKEIFRLVCRKLYPSYHTLVNGRNWQANLQQYRYGLEKVIADDGISVARGRHEWVTTKDEAADVFHVANRRLTTLEVLVEALEQVELLEKIQFSGRTGASEVSLKFKLHLLENEWLRLLDASTERVMFNGSQVQALPAESLLRYSRKNGYLETEIQEIIRLLMDRKYIDLDKKTGMIVRIIDAIEDLREAVRAMLDQLEKDIHLLQDALPDFDDRFYPIAKLRSNLDAAKERDEIEQVRNEARRLINNLNTYVGSRLTQMREKLRQEQEHLFTIVRQGLPAWLNYPFDPSPIFDPLERQRNNLVAAYQSTLDEMRRVRDASVRIAMEISGSNVEMIIKTYEQLRDFTDKSRKLTTRQQSYLDQQEDLNAWRKVAGQAAALDARAQSVAQVYNYTEFLALANELWKTLRTSFETDPLTIFSKHAKAHEQIENLAQRINAWLENRRKDFEEKCRAYQKALEEAGISAELRVPFDQEHPSESVEVLLSQVIRLVSQHMENVAWRLTQALTTVRYCILVQRLDLEGLEADLKLAIASASAIKERITDSTVRDFEEFKVNLINPIGALRSQEQRIYGEIQKALQKRPPEGSELRLMDLLQADKTGQQIDLRGLILSLIEQGETNVDLEKLMVDLKSLFQKNQISIHIELISSKQPE